VANLSAAALGAQVRPVAWAAERVLPVLAPFEPILAGGGLRRGSSVAVEAPSGWGARSLALALAAGASAAGSWCAAVGLADLGLLAAHETGVVLQRFPQVPAPPAKEWAGVVAALVEGVDIVLAGPPLGQIRPADGRRLAARARDRGAVMVRVGGHWPEMADVVLRVTAVEWEGLGRGHGHLRGRRVEVEVDGRRGSGSGRRTWLWLPHPSGGVAAAEPPARLAPVRVLRP
jgi:hypothetical protein